MFKISVHDTYPKQHHNSRQTAKLAVSDNNSLLLKEGCISILFDIYNQEHKMLSDERITKYQGLYKKRFGKEISREDALEQGIKLMRLMELIYKPMTEEEYQLLEKRRQETNN